MNKQSKINIGATLVAVGLIVGFLAYVFVDSNNSTAELPKSPSNNQTKSNDEVSQVSYKAKTEDQLLYLIEEEKLAHDVYTAMYQKYGSRVFGNILASESTHQAKVLALLQARNIQDPRSSTVGVFKNTELQALYDLLIGRGSQSAEEAYRVGVAIEEKDIKDISDQLATTQDEDIMATLEILRTGSENHLRAFNRQL